MEKSIAIRQSNNIYNQSLVASMLEHKGEDYTKQWLEKLVKNFSRKPQGNDRAQILSVAAGIKTSHCKYLLLRLNAVERKVKTKKSSPEG